MTMKSCDVTGMVIPTFRVGHWCGGGVRGVCDIASEVSLTIHGGETEMFLNMHFCGMF